MDQFHRFVFLLQIALHMSFLLLLQDLVDSDQNTRLLHLAKLVVDRSAEDTHLGREAHVGID